jgi:tetratricopeptide (TPR) repeat protein
MQADYADAYARRGWVFLMIKDYDRAEADFAKALELAPDHTYARSGREELYKDLGKTEQASADRDEAGGLSFEKFRRLVQKPGDAASAK